VEAFRESKRLVSPQLATSGGKYLQIGFGRPSLSASPEFYGRIGLAYRFGVRPFRLTINAESATSAGRASGIEHR